MESRVTVLTPNGRRQNVKVTPNTTVIQILEEVCAKQGFVSDDYTLKHHNKEVSLSQTFRFSGLPKNCLLEMSETVTKRVEYPVDICVQIENGSRHQAQFKPADNLWYVVKQLSGEAVDTYESPVVIYMRQEIMGEEEMTKMTLKSLGILEGRALLHLVNKSKEELKTQAMVYAPPAPKIEHKRDDKDNDKPKSSKAAVGGSGGFFITKDLVKSLKQAAETNETKKDEEEPVTNSDTPQVTEKSEKPKYDWGNAPGRLMQAKETNIDPEECENPDLEVEPEYHIIGERNAIMYCLDASQSQVEDLPDSFYDLTVHDLKLVLKDLRKIATGDEDAPLLTEKLREIENNNTMLRKISQYKNCAIRIQFPDRHVLQGMFKPIDKIADVLEFTKKFLTSPNQPCFLFTIPPKIKLDLNKTLLELDFVPNSLIHFALEDETLDSGGLIKDEFLSQLTLPEGALYAATKFRNQLHVVTEENNIKESKPLSPSTGAIPKRPRNDNVKKTNC